jgi:DNA-binding NtrC family response regulator
MNRSRVLVFDKRGELVPQASAELSPAEYQVEAVGHTAALLERVRSAPAPDLVVIDADAMKPAPERVIRELRQARPLLKILVHAREADLDHVVRAMQSGASGWIWSSSRAGELERAVRECFAPAQDDLAFRREAPGDVLEFDDGSFFVVASPAMQKLHADLERVAGIDVPVLFLGESGAGKEVAARWLHRTSARSRQVLLKVNCAAVPAELLESELFGYERGAFTGAVRAKPGKFEICNRGTLFLDELAEMPAAVQAKLLHVVQDQEFVRLGGCRRLKVSVRVIAATNVDIHEAIAEKRFREDLYYRLGAFVFEIPPLRTRREDIPILLRRYMARHAHTLGIPERVLSAGLWRQCLRYEWPGNVRQLENFAKRYLLFGEEAANLDAAEPWQRRENREPGEAEAAAISSALDQTNWNRKEAADLLGVSYKSLLLKIRRHGLDRSRTQFSTDGAGAPIR